MQSCLSLPCLWPDFKISFREKSTRSIQGAEYTSRGTQQVHECSSLWISRALIHRRTSFAQHGSSALCWKWQWPTPSSSMSASRCLPCPSTYYHSWASGSLSVRRYFFLSSQRSFLQFTKGKQRSGSRSYFIISPTSWGPQESWSCWRSGPAAVLTSSSTHQAAESRALTQTPTSSKPFRGAWTRTSLSTKSVSY